MEKVRREPVKVSLKENIEYLRDALGVEKSFDVIQLDVEYAEREMALYLVDGFVKDDILHYLMKMLAGLDAGQLEGDTLSRLIKTYIPYVEVETTDDLNKVVDMVLAGPTALVVDGVDEVILIDARTYPVRGPQEPDIERVVRGSRDGFVETLVFNTALTRRRIRDRTLRMEYMQVGRRSKTDVVVSYIEDIADPEMVQKVKDSISKIDTDGLPMAEKSIEEFISGRHWNPYPMVRYTERPDTAATHLYEGHVCIIVDGSPSVIITPTTFWHHLQHAEEYRNKPLVGAYLRFVRFLAVWASIFLLPLWYLFAIEPQLLPDALSYIGPNETGQLPLVIQFLMIELGLDMLRMAAIHTPSALATALGLVAALMIGQVAVEVGLFINEVILYLAIAAIGTFSTPSYEMSLANRLIRIALLIATSIFHTYGYVAGIMLLIIMLARMKSFGVPYLWPFIPFNLRAFRDVLLRSPIPLKNRRPRFLHPKDPDR
ncbi:MULTISPECIES: spore germination protein [Cytobacillus]|uniref:Spore gernimation protein GerA n=3 Tax=Cytobacillus TaxID=2675230 RepID=A0A160MEZ2_9BACI|nr:MULTISPECIES: spore germination protein [Cytobacillus]EFV77323.1 stage V sporulation protein AF [Bacillus sp. 2_A_57_CT2]MBY0154511.1 spore germination protein [Cytobacillus firmus]AND41503.1 spore gernimation protein GerA [Cytobacillus oceanisediminis 2691]MBU8731299.1 spore germination protein [Cytobacillus oceanisediminis]MCM3242240.1 spore germination protein [Cytobacillus oceanisediminis]